MSRDSMDRSASCPQCGAALADTAVLCIACGFDKRTGRRLETATLGKSPSEERAPGRREGDDLDPEPYSGPLALRIMQAILMPRIMQAILMPWYARLLSAPDSGLRRFGLWQVVVGVFGAIVWFAVFGALIWSLQALFPPGEIAAAPVPRRPSVPPKIFGRIFGLIFFLLFFPVGWSGMLVVIGLFHAILGVRFSRLNDWWNAQPVWRQIVSLPIILVIVIAPVAACVGLLLCAGWLYRVAIR
jgi:hypothetical protein